MAPIALLLAATLAQGKSEMQQPHTTRSINHYDVDLPTDFAIEDRSPRRADFDLYEITAGRSGAKLVLYVGNHPSFPKFKWAGAPVSESRDGRSAKEYRYSPAEKRMEGVLTFSGLSYKATESPYTHVHYFAADVDPSAARLFEDIIRSIRVARAHLD